MQVKRHTNIKHRNTLWTGNGPRADALGGGTASFSSYRRPFAVVRQCWSDEERRAGYLDAVGYGSMCVMAVAMCGNGDVVSTGLRLCRMPETLSSWAGRATMIAFVPLSLPVGMVSAAALGPPVGLLIARLHREDDLKRLACPRTQRSSTL